MELKFTQAIKDNWLANLKSGKFQQGFYSLVVNEDGFNIDMENKNLMAKKVEKVFYCCLGVLGECTEGLNNSKSGSVDPYVFLENTIGRALMENIYLTNDSKYDQADKRDYSNVIPLIESLPVQD